MMGKRKFWKALKTGEFAEVIRESSKGQVVSSSEEIRNIMKPLFADAIDVERMVKRWMTRKISGAGLM